MRTRERPVMLSCCSATEGIGSVHNNRENRNSRKSVQSNVWLCPPQLFHQLHKTSSPSSMRRLWGSSGARHRRVAAVMMWSTTSSVRAVAVGGAAAPAAVTTYSLCRVSWVSPAPVSTSATCWLTPSTPSKYKPSTVCLIRVHTHRSTPPSTSPPTRRVRVNRTCCSLVSINNLHTHSLTHLVSFLLVLSTISGVHHPPGQQNPSQHHSVLVPAGSAQRSHPGLWAAVLREGKYNYSTTILEYWNLKNKVSPQNLYFYWSFGFYSEHYIRVFIVFLTEPGRVELIADEESDQHRSHTRLKARNHLRLPGPGSDCRRIRTI